MIEILPHTAAAFMGGIVGVILANQSASKAEAALMATYNSVIDSLRVKVDEARSRVAKRRRLTSWDN